MKIRCLILIFTLSLIFTLAYHNKSDAAMSDYCASPPYISVTGKPNVLVVMDYSGSMAWPAYSTSGGSSFSGNYNSSTTYYGYFKTDKYYLNASGRFQVNTTCTDTNKIGSSNSCISGNLLNWITSTRVDVARKVLTGGRTSTGNADRLESEGDTFTYTDSNLSCTFETSVSGGNRRLSISGASCAIASLTNEYIRVDVQNVSEIRGIVQDFYDKVAFEFMVYGGSTRRGIIRSDKGATMSSLISAINTEAPDNNTPTGEALWEAYDFFTQNDGYNYESNTSSLGAGDGGKDPWYDGSGANSTPVPCRKGFVMLVSDGAWNGGVDPMGPARTMLINDLRSAAALPGRQNVMTYAVYAFSSDANGRQAMITTAMFGGFDDYNSDTWPYPFTAYPTSSLNVTYPRTECNNPTRWDSGCMEWDKDRNNLPDNFFEADDGEKLKTAIFNALMDILKRVSSGTAASVLASGEGSGANILQAMYYPRRQFEGNITSWVGSLQNLWFYVDPFLANSAMREDTPTKDSILDLSEDYIIQFYSDPILNTTMLRRRVDSDGDGDIDSSLPSVAFESANNLWDAGRILWERNITASGIPRKIFTSLDGTTHLPIIDTTTGNPINVATLKPYMDLALATDAEVSNIIKYIHGEDITQDTTPADGINDYRLRTATIGTNTRVWKLGDIVNSTPKIASFVPVNTYHCGKPKYNDITYGGPGDLPCYESGSTGVGYINTTGYKNRNMVFTGGNDGMLHAFKLGALEYNGAWKTENDEKARLAGSNLGEERWAFIPKNVLPYLKYIADPNYCHIYTVDLTPYLVDASIGGNPGDTKPADGSSWRTILIGGMRTGGACRGTTTTCTDVDGDGIKDCVNTPVTVSGVGDVGFSSYFAIDVTDPENPDLLWEFTHPELGFTTSGPAVVRIGPGDQNGNWFVVFGSGPTGPISNFQFMGRSDQNLKFFIFDLENGPGAANIDVKIINTTIPNAFAGSMVNSTIDTDVNYSDEAIYVGYVKRADNTSRPPDPPAAPTYKWTNGGIGKIVTYENPDPLTWSWRIVMDGIGPVISAVERLQNPGLIDSSRRSLWLLFGTGRYYYSIGSAIDDQTIQRRLFSVKERCFNDDGQYGILDPACTSTVAIGDLTNITNVASVPSEATAYSAGFRGWYINLDPTDAYSYAECQTYNSTGDCTSLANVSRNYGAERMITSPAVSSSECVFFTSYKPYSDACALGGKTFIWATKFNTGGACTLKGKALIQVSTGAIEEVDLNDAFTEAGGRKSGAIEGAPPSDTGPSAVQPPQPVKRILHIRER